MAIATDFTADGIELVSGIGVFSSEYVAPELIGRASGDAPTILLLAPL